MSVPAELREKADQIRSGRKSSVKVRTLLDWFGAQRRRQSVVAAITEALAEVGLATDPSFESAFIDERISFALTASKGPTTTPESVLVLDPPTSPSGAPPTPVDPTYRIGKLRSANNPPVCVKPDDSLQDAVTLMMKHDYSQLPITTSSREVKGMISWRSIGHQLGRGRAVVRVLDAAEQHYELSADTSLFEAIALIVQRDCVLIRDHTKVISGIVTAADLCEQFESLTEPFLLLNEVEDHIRSLITGRFVLAELAAARDPGSSARPVTRVADLTLGEYLRLLEGPQDWERLNLGVSRAIFTDELRVVLDVRNDVMHFDPDGIPEGDLKALRKFVRFLRSLQSRTSS